MIVFVLEREERKKSRLAEGLPAESESSSDESFQFDDSIMQSRLEVSPKSENTVSKVNYHASPKPPVARESPNGKIETTAPKRRGRPPFKAKKIAEQR